MADDTLKRGMFSKMAEALGNVFHRQPQRYYLDDSELQLLNISPDTVTTEERVISLDSDMYKKLQEAKARLEQKAGGGIVRLAKGGSDRTEEYERLMMILDTYGPESDEFKNEYQQFIVRFPEMGVVRKAQGGPMDTENVGIMDGVGVGADAILQQEKAIDSADSFDGVMTAVRGKEMNEAEARGELAEIVGPEDAQQTPDSVLALVQPVIEMAQGPGIAQFVEEAGVEEQGPMMAQAQQPMMPQQMMPQTMAQGGPVYKMSTGLTPEMINMLMSSQQPLSLEQMYEQRLPFYQEAYKTDDNTTEKMGKANILFQIAQAGLNLASQPKPGESADPITRLAESTAGPLAKIGEIASGVAAARENREALANAGALTSAENQFLKEIDAQTDITQTMIKEAGGDSSDAQKLASDVKSVLYQDPETNTLQITKGFIDDKSGVLQLQQKDGQFIAQPTVKTYVMQDDRSKFFIEPNQKIQIEQLEGLGTINAGLDSGKQIIKSIAQNMQEGDSPIVGVAGLINRYMNLAGGMFKDATEFSIGDAMLGLADQDAKFVERLDNSLEKSKQDIAAYERSLGDDATAQDKEVIATMREMLNPGSKGILVDYEVETYRDEFTGEPRQRIVEGSKVYKKLSDFNDQKDIFQNQVRINSLAYALARSRKSSGRLNLDDLERASKAINIDSGNQESVVNGLLAAVNELTYNGKKFLENYYRAGGIEVNKDWEAFGLTADQQQQYKDQLRNQYLASTYFPENKSLVQDPSTFVKFNPKQYRFAEFMLGAQSDQPVEEVQKKIEEQGGGVTLDDLDKEYLGN